MSESAESPLELAPPPADCGLRCPTCEYNLTGVAENRCPECGEPFDPEKLRAILAGLMQPIPIWEDMRTLWIMRFVALCLTTWFAPWRIGERFPECYDAIQTFRFRTLVIGMGLLAYVCVVGYWVLGRGAGYGIIAFPFIVFGAVAGIVVCEALVNLVFRWCLSRPPPRGWAGSDGGTPSSSWRGLIGMFRTHAILSTVILGGGTTIITYYPNYYGLVEPGYWCPVAAVLLAWWWFSLGMAVAARPHPAKHRVLAILLIPVAALLSIAVGVGAALLVALACFTH